MESRVLFADSHFAFFRAYLRQKIMNDALRKYLRRLVLEEISSQEKNDGLTPIEGKALVDPKPKQLKDTSKPEVVGDPVEDVELNTMVDDAGSDEKAATAVAVKPGATKGGNGPTAGQANPKFTSKTKAPDKLPGAKK
jgi:hypothetical protein